MGTVTSLIEYRQRKSGPPSAVERLERAVTRLGPLIGSRDRLPEPTLERELRQIVRQVADGRHGQAAERAERLLAILAHPALSG